MVRSCVLLLFHAIWSLNYTSYLCMKGIGSQQRKCAAARFYNVYSYVWSQRDNRKGGGPMAGSWSPQHAAVHQNKTKIRLGPKGFCWNVKWFVRMFCAVVEPTVEGICENGCNYVVCRATHVNGTARFLRNLILCPENGALGNDLVLCVTKTLNLTIYGTFTICYIIDEISKCYFSSLIKMRSK